MDQEDSEETDPPKQVASDKSRNMIYSNQSSPKKEGNNLKSLDRKDLGLGEHIKRPPPVIKQVMAGLFETLITNEGRKEKAKTGMKMIWYPRVEESKGTKRIAAKEGRSCTLVDDTLFLFGGYGPNEGAEQTLQAFNFKSRTLQDVAPVNRAIEPRAFHSAVLYKQQSLVVFGGEVFNSFKGYKVVSNELVIFNIKKNELLKLPLHRPVDPRKYHAACLLNHYMVVSGGVDEEFKTLKQIDVFDISNSAIKKTLNSGSTIQWFLTRKASIATR